MNEANLSAMLQEAVSLHQRGRLREARALYERVLEQAPRQFDALHLLGVIARQEGQPRRAVELISDALGINPAHAAANCNLGAALLDLGRTEDALACYDRAVRIHPGYALAFSNRGNALRKLGRLEDALASYERALAIRPAYPEAACNRAIVLNDMGRPAEALAGAAQALAARPGYPDAWVAQGNALQGIGRFAEAVESYGRALALKGDDAQAWCSRGAALKRMNELAAALQSYDRAVALDPAYALAHHYRANTLRAMGRSDDAIAAYRQALALGADAEQVSFALASLGAGPVPCGSPESYVRELFDQYAGHFDQHLVEVLGYRTPALLDAALRRAAVPEGAEILDLGCGTGLMAPHLRPYAARLSGVDLSAKMLDKARERGQYDELSCAAIGAYLSARADEFDVIVAADVFVYFGDLDLVFAQVHAALRAGGCFCFSVEAGEVGDYTLRPSNRFAHSIAYLARLAAAHGFLLVESERATLRSDSGAAVDGYLLVMRSLKQGANPRLRWLAAG